MIIDRDLYGRVLLPSQLRRSWNGIWRLYRRTSSAHSDLHRGFSVVQCPDATTDHHGHDSTCPTIRQRVHGAGALAEAWCDRPDVQLIEDLRGRSILSRWWSATVLRAGSPGSMCLHRTCPRFWPGTGPRRSRRSPLAYQTRCTFANFGETEPLALDEYQARGGLSGIEAAFRLGRCHHQKNCVSRITRAAARHFRYGTSGRSLNRQR